MAIPARASERVRFEQWVSRCGCDHHAQAGLQVRLLFEPPGENNLHQMAPGRNRQHANRFLEVPLSH